MDDVAGWTINNTLLAVESMGPPGFLLMVLVCVGARVTAVPTTVIELAAGCLYGVCGGTIVGALGKTLGSFVPFAVARMVGQRRGWQVPEGIREKYLQSTHTHPVMTTMALRVAPIPCGGSAKDAALGLLDSPSPCQFVLGNILVYTPFSLVWACIGCQAKNVVAAFELAPQMPPFLRQVLVFAGPIALAALLLGMGVNIWKTWVRGDGSEPAKTQKEQGSGLVADDSPLELMTSVDSSINFRTARSPASPE
jgi:uncharacterized membrane protein YdjX (TVP38/TMEM64 family)